MSFKEYPYIEKAITEIAYDNGCVNRVSTIEDVLRRTDAALKDEFSTDQLKEVEEYLVTFPAVELMEMCTGEQKKLEGKNVPELVNNVLNYAFEHLILTTGEKESCE